MNPEQIELRAIAQILREARGEPRMLDDETIFCIAERGIQGIRPEMRAHAMSVIASNPELLGMIDEIREFHLSYTAQTSANRSLLSSLARVIFHPFDALRSAVIDGLTTLQWRLTCAASSLAAVGGSVWVWLGARAMPQPALLDGSSPSLPSAAPGLNGLVLTLLVIAWLLVGVTFVPAFIMPLRDRHSMHRGHVGE